MASAMAPGSTLWSYDLHVPLGPDLPGAALDRELSDALERLGVADGVHLMVGDSRTVEMPSNDLDILFIDGDHSYEGSKADWERWAPQVRGGGHLLFHDSVDTGGYGNVYPGVQKAMAECAASGLFVRATDAGTIAHLVRRDAS